MHRRTIAGLAALLAVAALGLPALTESAAAQAPAARQGSGDIGAAASLSAGIRQADRGTGAAADSSAVSAYWTPQRMREAIPADQQPGLAGAAARFRASQSGPTRAAGEAAQTGRPGLIDPARPAAAAAGARPASWAPGYAGWQPVDRTYGKVFFTNATNHLNYVCSATVVNSQGRDTVWTAGHCVHGGSGGTWHQNWVFVPAYDNGAPYGTWPATQLWTRTAWANSSDFTQDMGAAIVQVRYGWHIVDLVGGQGIAWNYNKYYQANDFGYPQAPPFTGSTLIECSGSTSPEWVFGPFSASTIGLPCDMTGGSSGGAWLRWFNGDWGYINGHNDYKYSSDPNTMYSPYYGDDAASLYGAVRGL